ncbi:transglycosylase domain-containing protein [Sphingobacterium paucimobilis]|uniref:Glycosyl transferase family 51 domain-containing protein n=1 Tax=Sphingobacterium paucimobilis HER1398 TaxID=1346330 RepID=U2JER1_9SPHI|nr:biosynthetic peptidoglycan transglycosylase [Sphingobacterium paucimobilis]ERJ61148.1 hypothetical protein M472_20565 [Sphingobacterium paucimobilis HER1398]
MRFSSSRKKWLIIALGVLVVLFGAAFAFAMSKRQGYLDMAVHKAQAKLKKDYQLDFNVANYRFDGLTTVVFDRVALIPVGRDTLATMDHLGVGIRVWPLLFGEVKIGHFDLDKGKVSFVKKDTLSNYDFLFRKKEKDSTSVEEPNERNFAEWAQRLAKQIFSKVPSNMRMNDFEISYRDSLLHQRIRVPKAIVDDGDFETSLFLNDHDAEWRLQGYVNGDQQKLKVEVSSKEKNTELPFLRGKYGLGISFDKLVFDLAGIRKVEKDLLHVTGAVEYDNLVVRHRRLSDEPVVLPHGQATGGFAIANDYIALTDKSKITVKEFSVSPKAKFTIKPAKKIELSVRTGPFVAQNFFDAIPVGLFESLEGIGVTGQVDYNLDFAVELDNPDNIVFKSSIDDTDLKVLHWGKAKVDSLNFPFEYDAYDDTTFVRHIVVGPSNPDFTPLGQIPYVLKTTVRNTEDPFFYTHNGFEEEAFKLSIRTNIKERKFKRGASTLSMQLVKNVFLNRKKTMTRKFEEILLVWLLEASGQVSKDRLFEIYLNVIEWGKDVYGIAEASRYYFKKRPQELNLGESLFLSSIVPRPKTGLSSFDYTGHLKPWVQRHFNTYGYIMTKVGDLKEVNVPANYGFYDVVLQSGLRPPAPLVRDTVSLGVVEEHERLMEEMEREETAKKSILEKLMNKEQKN